jgi:hypothetical protein
MGVREPWWECYGDMVGKGGKRWPLKRDNALHRILQAVVGVERASKAGQTVKAWRCVPAEQPAALA